MKMRHRITTLLLSFALVATGIFLSSITLPGHHVAAQSEEQQQKPDKRKKTTVQHATVAVGDNQKAVELLYLDMPWGETTFGYLEDGGSDYYSTRTWPIAHIKLAVAARYNGLPVQPGDYVLYITPKNGKKNPKMTMALASFKAEDESGTFLVAGDVFTDTPTLIRTISKKPVAFEKGAPQADFLKIDLEKADSSREVAIKIHYGDRTHTEKLLLAK